MPVWVSPSGFCSGCIGHSKSYMLCMSWSVGEHDPVTASGICFLCSCHRKPCAQTFQDKEFAGCRSMKHVQQEVRNIELCSLPDEQTSNVFVQS